MIYSSTPAKLGELSKNLAHGVNFSGESTVTIIMHKQLQKRVGGSTLDPCVTFGGDIDDVANGRPTASTRK